MERIKQPDMKASILPKATSPWAIEIGAMFGNIDGVASHRIAVASLRAFPYTVRRQRCVRNGGSVGRCTLVAVQTYTAIGQHQVKGVSEAKGSVLAWWPPSLHQQGHYAREIGWEMNA